MDCPPVSLLLVSDASPAHAESYRRLPLRIAQEDPASGQTVHLPAAYLFLQQPLWLCQEESRTAAGKH